MKFEPQLIGDVYSRFGEETEMITSSNRIMATVRVQPSSAFWEWIFQFGKGIKILSPEGVVEEGNARVKELME